MRKHKKSSGKSRISGIILHIVLIAAGFVIAVMLGIFVVKAFGMHTVVIDQAMSPTLEKEEVVLVNKLSYRISSPARFDVVAIRMGETESAPTYIRRIIGLPGETVTISNGVIYIDGTEITKTFNSDEIEDAGGAEDGVTLGDDEYFVLCDNYNGSRDDSRLDSIGYISSSQITGHAWWCISSFGFVR